MIVHVRLHTTLRRETPEGIVDRLDLELQPGATVRDVLDRLEINPRGRSILMVVNRNLAKAEQELADGDEVRLIPAMSGGD
jgi:molybdopterin converting factor small subunit